MIWLAAIFLCAVFLPTLWVRWVMQRYAREVPNLPGTGGELAKHLIQRFELDGVKFGFIPKLDEMSLGEYIDLESTFGDWEKMHKAMAILYRVVNFEKGEKYNIVSYETNEELAEAMKMMPLSVVMSCMVFFYALGTQLAQATLSYTQKLVKKSSTTSQVREALELNGVGINQFTDSLKAMSEDLMKLQPYHSTNV